MQKRKCLRTLHRRRRRRSTPYVDAYEQLVSETQKSLAKYASEARRFALEKCQLEGHWYARLSGEEEDRLVAYCLCCGEPLRLTPEQSEVVAVGKRFRAWWPDEALRARERMQTVKSFPEGVRLAIELAGEYTARELSERITRMMEHVEASRGKSVGFRFAAKPSR